MADDRAELAAILGNRAATVGPVDDTLRLNRDRDQRWIARLVVSTFILAVLALFCATWWLAANSPAPAAGQQPVWKEPAAALFAVVAQVLLPVVTLVVGFYFGSEKR